MKNKDTKSDKIIEIFSGTLWEAELIKSLFEDSEIRCFVKNNTLNSYAFESTNSEGVKVMISSFDRERAQIVVDDFYSK